MLTVCRQSVIIVKETETKELAIYSQENKLCAVMDSEKPRMWYAANNVLSHYAWLSSDL